MDAETLPVSVVAGMPVRSLALEVVDGPDRGKSFTAHSDRATVGTAQDNDLCLSDPTVSRYHLELVRRGDRVLVHDQGSLNRTLTGNVQLERGAVVPGTILQLGRTSLRVGEGGTVNLELHPQESLGSLKGRSPAMRHLLAKVKRAAQSDASVLLVGESGTGKEGVARALHELGPRQRAPLVTVDCGSLSPGLVASELFGHEKGAFTGADRRHVGAFERAHGGTVFLDEVGELPAALQATLLGVLERRRFRRVGGTEEIKIDVRVVGATHRDLRAEVNSGAFRLDLYYRLAVVRLELPPLRERTEDIPLLVEHFLREAGFQGPVEAVFGADLLQQLYAHRWPGNIRELRNLVESVLAVGEAPPLDGAAAAAPAEASALPLPYREARGRVLQDFERRFLTELLQRSAGNVSQAARLARMDRTHLTELLQRHGLR